MAGVIQSWMANEPKGLSELRGYVDGHERPLRLGVVYRDKARAQGQILNMCPWCGGDLRWFPPQGVGNGFVGGRT